MLAGHGLEMSARSSEIAFEVGIDAEPLHDASDAHLLLADDGNIVFGIAGNNACVATGAAIHVDRHAPFVPVVLPVGEHRGVILGRFVTFAFMRAARKRCSSG